MKRSELFSAVSARKAELNAREERLNEFQRRLAAIAEALGELEHGVTLTRLTAFYNAAKTIAAGK